MQEIIMTAVGIITVGGVLIYVFFSKPKSLKPKLDNEKTFLGAEVTWGGEEPKKVYKKLRNTKPKVTFKGNHKIF